MINMTTRRSCSLCLCIIVMVLPSLAIPPTGEQEVQLNRQGSVKSQHVDNRGRKSEAFAEGRNKQALVSRTEFSKGSPLVAASAADSRRITAGRGNNDEAIVQKQNGDTYKAYTGNKQSQVQYKPDRRDSQGNTVNDATVEAAGRSYDTELVRKAGRSGVAKVFRVNGKTYVTEFDGQNSAEVYEEGNQGNPLYTAKDLNNRNGVKLEAHQDVYVNRQYVRKGKGTASSQAISGGSKNCYKEGFLGIKSNCADIERNGERLVAKGPVPFVQSVGIDGSRRNKEVKVLGAGYPNPRPYGALRFKEGQDKTCETQLHPESGGNWELYKSNTDVQFKRMEMMPPGFSGTGRPIEFKGCLEVRLPVTFPAGYDLKDMTMSLGVYMPDCGRLNCKGKSCIDSGNSFLSRFFGGGGAATDNTVLESCYLKDLCEFEQVSRSGQQKDVFTPKGRCPPPGSTIRVTATVCLPEDRQSLSDVCLKQANDKEISETDILVIAKIYKKDRGDPDSCKSEKALGCHLLSTKVEMNIFGLNLATKKAQMGKIARDRSSFSGGSSGGSNGGSGSGVTTTAWYQRTSTLAPITTTARSNWWDRRTAAPKPTKSTGTNWWQRIGGNRWGGK